MTPFDCPRCGSTLTMSERHGIEIDYCPQCRGVWLDRGELDKIIDRVADQPAGASAGWTQPQAPTVPPAAGPGGWAPPPAWTATPPQHHQQGYRHGDDDDDDHRRRGGYGKPRKHWLSELFD